MKLKYKNRIIDFDLLKKDDIINLILYDTNLKFKTEQINDQSIIITTEKEKKTVYFVDKKNSIIVNIDGHNYNFEKIDENEFFEFDSSNNKDFDIIKSPMPGSVIKVLVKIGDKVEEGSALLIVEAMKMETTLYSSIDGKVTEINTNAGEQVSPDKELIKIEKITD